MMEYIFIDPKMFMSPKEDTLSEDIDFFQEIIDLNNSGIITVCLYKEIIDKLLNSYVRPFPIDIAKIQNPELKDKIKSLNVAFDVSLKFHYKIIDIDSCNGQQKFDIDKNELKNDDDYFAFFSMLLVSCYTDEKISDRVLVGKFNQGIQFDEKVSLSCSCQTQEYKNTYRWVSPDDFLTPRMEALKLLKKAVGVQRDLFVESPVITKGKHHNKIQRNDFNCFEELSPKNKRVLRYFRKLGLSEICFKEFYPHKGEIGNIKINDCTMSTDEKTDIVTGYFISELGFQISVRLYFPEGIGKGLQLYSEGEINQKDIEQLVTDLGL